MKLKNIKKLFIILITLVLSFFIFGGTKVSAAYATSDNLNASYEQQQTVKSARYDYTNYKVDLGLTTTSKATSKQTVSVFTQKQTENSKVVSWAVSTNTGFLYRTIPQIANDYEKYHPDWFVVGGINADQYIMSGGSGGVSNGTDYFYPQPYYPMVSDGESWFSVPCWPSSGGGNLAAFLQDGSTDPIVSGSMNFNSGDVKIKGLILAIFNEAGEIEKEFFVQNVNKEPKDGETSVYVCFTQSGASTANGLAVFDMDIRGTNLYISEQADLAYMSNNASYSSWKKASDSFDSLFCKGTLTKKESSYTLKNGSFAIDSKNSEVLEALSLGKFVRVQYELEGVYSEVESVIGYHTIQRMDNKDIPSTASYNTQTYSRSMFGRTSSGQIVLITIDMRHEEGVGTSHDETNAVLKYYGCVEAYQMDGGSSVAAVGRNENGEIVVIDHPYGYSGNSTRSVLSALLVVERRKPEYNVELVEATQTSLKFKVDPINEHGRDIKRVYIKVNDKDYEVVDGYATVTGLRKNKEYNWNLCYEDNTGSDFKTESKGTEATAKDAPIFNSCDVNKSLSNDNQITFDLDFTDRGESLLEYAIINGDNINKVTDMSIKQISTPKTNNVIYLEYSYSQGSQVVVVKIKWPHYKAYQKLEKISQNQDDLLGQFFRGNG